MDILKSIEKPGFENSIKHNIFNNPNKAHFEQPKIENRQWSTTNDQLQVSRTSEKYATIEDDKIGNTRRSDIYDQLRLSSTSENYATIKDHNVEDTRLRVANDQLRVSNTSENYDRIIDGSTHEDSVTTNNNNAISGEAESAPHIYLSLSDKPTILNLQNIEKTPNYSYAKNGEIIIRIVDEDIRQDQSNAGSISNQNSGSQNPYDNNNHAPHSQDPQLYNDYLLPYATKPNLGETGKSEYVICKIPVRLPKVDPLLPSREQDKRNPRKCKLILVLCVVLCLLVVTAAVITFIMVTKSKEHDECDEKTECLTKCPNYTDISNGHSNVTDEVSPLTVAQITCDKGFKVESDETAIANCLETGKWSKTITCEPVDCGTYQPPNNVYIAQNEHKTTFGTLINAACDPGFEFTTNSDRYITCNENGKWAGNPICENLVHLSIDNDVFLIGEVASLSCEFRNVPKWKNIYFKHTSRNNETMIIASIENNIDSYLLTQNSENVNVVEKTFTHDSGKFRMTLDTVQCSDTFEKPGEIKVECVIDIRDTVDTYRDEKDVRIQGKAVKPELSISPHVVKGEDTSTYFQCEMLFPEPNGHLLIEADLDGPFSTLLSSVNGEYSTNVAWIEDIKVKLERCWYRTVVTFGLKTVSMKWHRKHIRCTAKPSEDAVDPTELVSESEVVKVIKDNVCRGEVSAPYPYDCGYFIMCDDNNQYDSILEVRACGQNQCYDESISTCSTCSSISGCPMTDIYIHDGKSGVIRGQIDIICVVENVKGLTDIKITRGNGESVSSIKRGDNIGGFETIADMTHLNGTNGMLSIHVEYLLCRDKATYRCQPEGSETSLPDDVIDLDFKCV